MVAAELAATSPHRVERLVLIAPIGLWRDDHPVPDISGMPPDRLPGLVLADPEGPLAAMLPAPDPTDPESLFRASQTMASILQFIWPLPDKGLSKRLYRLKAPTLLVWGAQDKLVDPAYGEDFAAAIADARLEIVDGAGHLPQLEQPERTIGLITDFLG
jgi:pimeloyl-ACP methyl ester carboxylesterase